MNRERRESIEVISDALRKQLNEARIERKEKKKNNNNNNNNNKGRLRLNARCSNSGGTSD
jgi:hypothetical protein